MRCWGAPPSTRFITTGSASSQPLLDDRDRQIGLLRQSVPAPNARYGARGAGEGMGPPWWFGAGARRLALAL